MAPAWTVGFQFFRDGKTAYERSVGRRAVPPLAQFGEWVWWIPVQPFNRRLGPLQSRHEQGRYLGPLDRSNTVLVGTASGESPNDQTVAASRTVRGMLVGRGTRQRTLAPNALEDDGGRIGISAPVLQPHAAVHLPPLVPEFRQVRRAPLRRTDFEQFGHTDSCPGCANARAGRKQAVDRSEQCRSRMEALLETTTEGHMRLERPQSAEKPSVMELQRKRRRPEGEGRQPRAPPVPPASESLESGGRSSYHVGGGRSSSSATSA